MADKTDKKSLVGAQEKALQAAAKAKESWQKVQQLAQAKNKQDKGVTVTKLQKVDDKALKSRSEKPPTAEKL